MNEIRKRSRLPGIGLALIAALAITLAGCGRDSGGGGQSFGNGEDAGSSGDVMDSGGSIDY